MRHRNASHLLGESERTVNIFLFPSIEFLSIDLSVECGESGGINVVVPTLVSNFMSFYC